MPNITGWTPFRLADPILTAVHDNGLAGNECGIVGCFEKRTSIEHRGQGHSSLTTKNEIFERSIETVRRRAGRADPRQFTLRVEESAERRRPLLLEVAVPLESAL
jgi:hypothetical protein